jgi:ribonuclease T1
MVSRIPPPEDGVPASRPGRPTGLLALLLVVVFAVGGWLLTGGDTDPGTSVVADDTSPSAPAAVPSDQGSDPAGEGETDDVDPEPPEPSGPPGSAGLDADSGLPTVYLLDLPPEAAATVEAIERGPPYAYDQDGGTFQNREGLLPDRGDGYYLEFTVETPGSSDRGARRIVTGAEGELYWTDDHYASFSRILL